MKTISKRAVLVVSLLAVGAALTPYAYSPAWPARPVRVVVNVAAGTGPDMIARVFAGPLGDALGQPIVIENRAGAGGNIGLEAAARSAPDGYTLLSTPGGPMVIGPHVYKGSIDVANELEPVAPTARTIMLLVVRPSIPVRSVAELVAYARANPGKLNFGSGGPGGGLHIAAEMLLRKANIRATHVPYKVATQVLTDMLGGQIDFTFDTGSAVPYSVVMIFIFEPMLLDDLSSSSITLDAASRFLESGAVIMCTISDCFSNSNAISSISCVRSITT